MPEIDDGFVIQAGSPEGGVKPACIRSVLARWGIAPDRISGASFGEFKPARPNDSPENLAANRRIEIVVVPDLTGLPGFEEHQKVNQ